MGGHSTPAARPFSPLAPWERLLLLNAVPLLLAGAAAAWLLGWWWATLPAMVLLAVSTTARAVKSCRARAWQDAYLAASTTLLIALAGLAAVTRWLWLWLAFLLIALSSATLALMQNRRDAKAAKARHAEFDAKLRRLYKGWPPA